MNHAKPLPVSHYKVSCSLHYIPHVPKNMNNGGLSDVSGFILWVVILCNQYTVFDQMSLYIYRELLEILVCRGEMEILELR